MGGAVLCWLWGPEKSPVDKTAEWPGWRGANRDGHAAWLPEKLPAAPRVVWRKPLHGTVLAGPAVADGFVVVADRDLFDTKDVFHCLRAADGAKVWDLEYPAAGNLDYGCSPRATPMIYAGRAYLLGALGALHCVKLATGEAVWKKDLATDFGAERPDWGWTGAPLIVDNEPDRQSRRDQRRAGGAGPAHRRSALENSGRSGRLRGVDLRAVWRAARNRRVRQTVARRMGPANWPALVETDAA